MSSNDLKRRKLTPPKSELHAKTRDISHSPSSKDDKIDPVEKLLSMTYSHSDIWSHMEDQEPSISTAASTNASSTNLAQGPNLSDNFRKVINENLRSYYSKIRRSQMEIHNDHSSFSVLNRPQVVEAPQSNVPANRVQVPFFRAVNFNPQPSLGHQLDDYIYYGDEDSEEPLSTDSEQEELAPSESPVQAPLSPLSGKMSFHYRQNSNFNLALSDESAHEPAQNDIFKFMNQRSVFSGKASEMIGTSNFLASDFFF